MVRKVRPLARLVANGTGVPLLVATCTPTPVAAGAVPVPLGSRASTPLVALIATRAGSMRYCKELLTRVPLLVLVPDGELPLCETQFGPLVV